MLQIPLSCWYCRQCTYSPQLKQHTCCWQLQKCYSHIFMYFCTHVKSTNILLNQVPILPPLRCWRVYSRKHSTFCNSAFSNVANFPLRRRTIPSPVGWLAASQASPAKHPILVSLSVFCCCQLPSATLYLASVATSLARHVDLFAFGFFHHCQWRCHYNWSI